MEYKNVLIEREGAVAVLKVNRPDALNSLNQDTLHDLIAAVDELEKDESVRTIILTGEGKAFVAGADIKAMLPYSAPEARGFSETGPPFDE